MPRLLLISGRVLWWTVVILLLSGISLEGKNRSMHWGYKDVTDEIPPTKWQANYPSCNGTRQSPIAINTSLLQHDDSLQAIKFVQYDEHPFNSTWTVLDNGHAVQFNFSAPLPDSVQSPAIQNGGLGGTYNLLQFHFHWGSQDSRGSEHVLDGRRLPLELHLVHRKSTDNDISAVTDSTGLAVVGVLFELAGPNDPTNIHLELLSQAVQRAVEPQIPVNVSLPSFSLSHLLPKSPNFYRYLGSLTTPPCSEDVVWSIMEERMKITEQQLNIFRQLHEQFNDSVDLLSDNFRPLQSYNGRVIRAFQLAPMVPRKNLLVHSEFEKGGASGNSIASASNEAFSLRKSGSSLHAFLLLSYGLLRLFCSN